jgi:hypothetical protein
VLVQVQYSCSHLFPMLAAEAPDVIPTGAVLRMAERALEGLTAGMEPAAVRVVGGAMKALACEGVLQQEHQGRVISLCLKALQIHGMSTHARPHAGVAGAMAYFVAGAMAVRITTPSLQASHQVGHVRS